MAVGLILGAAGGYALFALRLDEAGFRVLLIDTEWNGIGAARMENLEICYGNPVSEYDDRHLDLVGIGGLFALSSRDANNALAFLRASSDSRRARPRRRPAPSASMLSARSAAHCSAPASITPGWPA